MTTLRQIAANRRNAQLSTGPVTKVNEHPDEMPSDTGSLQKQLSMGWKTPRTMRLSNLPGQPTMMGNQRSREN